MLKSVSGVVGAALVACVLAAGVSHADPLAVLPGKFDVLPSGDASFSIPISVPPGTAGMEPSLSVNYASGAGSGILGTGWSLSGLLSITRCPQTQAQDGVIGSITYTASDRFCLGGQRLIVINGGVYGADGSEYRTEIEGFTRVIAHGSVGGGPAYFDVYTKSGQTIELGNGSNSAVMLSGITAIRSWLVDKITDTSGNYLSVSYVVNPGGVAGDSEVLPNQIAYAGNSNTGLAPYNKVSFVYATRPDIVPLYTDEALSENTQRLTDIKTYAGSTQVSDYQFSYAASSATNRSLLSGVTLCGSGICLPARSFTYQAGGMIPNGNVNWNFAGHGTYVGYQGYPADFAGAGQSGLLLVAGSNGVANGNGIAVLLNKGGGNFATTTAPTIVTIPSNMVAQVNGFTPVIGDFNGDGKQDIFWYQLVSGSGIGANYIWLSNGDGTFNVVSNPFPVTSGNSVPTANKVLVGDFNGDGKSDLFFYNADPIGRLLQVVFGGGLLVPYFYSASFSYSESNCVSTSNCSFSAMTSQAYFSGSPIPSPIIGAKPYLFDVNGDGKTDFVWIVEDQYGRVNSQTATIWYGAPTFASSSSVIDTNYTPTSPTSTFSLASVQGDVPVLGDFNGDGLPDIFWDPEDGSGRSTGGSQSLWLNTGSGAGYQTIAIPSNLSGEVNGFRPLAGDFNGDGLTDIFWDQEATDGNTDGSRAIWTSIGSGFNVATTNVANLNGQYNDSNGYHPLVADFTGDGKADILWDDYGSGGASWGYRVLWSSDGIQPDLLTSLGNGVGASTTINYGTLSAGWGSYYSGWTSPVCSASPASYPILDIAPAQPVVTATSSTNGVGGVYNSSYGYACARVDVSGRGFLGYARETVTDPQTGIVQTSNFLQNFPFTGMVSSETKTLSVPLGILPLNTTTNSYGLMTASTSPTALPWSGTWFPYLASTMSSSDDLNGTALPSTTTSVSYDAYGNALTVSSSSSDGYSKTTVNTYSNNASTWLLGRLTQSQVTSTGP